MATNEIEKPKISSKKRNAFIFGAYSRGTRLRKAILREALFRVRLFRDTRLHILPLEKWIFGNSKIKKGRRGKQRNSLVNCLVYKH